MEIKVDVTEQLDKLGLLTEINNSGEIKNPFKDKELAIIIANLLSEGKYNYAGIFTTDFGERKKCDFCPSKTHHKKFVKAGIEITITPIKDKKIYLHRTCASSQNKFINTKPFLDYLTGNFKHLTDMKEPEESEQKEVFLKEKAISFSNLAEDVDKLYRTLYDSKPTATQPNWYNIVKAGVSKQKLDTILLEKEKIWQKSYEGFISLYSELQEVGHANKFDLKRINTFLIHGHFTAKKEYDSTINKINSKIEKLSSSIEDYKKTNSSEKIIKRKEKEISQLKEVIKTAKKPGEYAQKLNSINVLSKKYSLNLV